MTTTACPACGVFDTGQTINLKLKVSQDGALTDPATLTLILRPPDGPNETVAVIDHDGLGLYHAQFTLPVDDSEGQWYFRWVTAGVADGVQEGSFVVRRSRVLVS